ncbi:MAG: phosphotransferase, partial [Actinomycetota bacterium]|nr:phosphotransferase [Actinomycetota bacterium]
MELASDPRLEAAIHAVTAWHGRDIGVTPVSVDHDERHFLIEVDDELFVLRLMSPTSARAGLDETGELEVARAAASAGVAPELVAVLPELGCLVTRFAPGRRISASDLMDDDLLTSIVGSIRALHACPPPTTRRSVFSEARELRHSAIDRGVAMPATEQPATEAMRCIEDIGDIDLPMVACHGDLTRANLFVDGEQVWVVDYRWAGAGDPYEDLGSIATHLDLDDERCDALIGLYFGRIDEAARSRLA